MSFRSDIGSGKFRVAVLNDYSMEQALKLVSRGQYPSQHTWGASLFGKLGAKVIVPKFRGAGLWHLLKRR